MDELSSILEWGTNTLLLAWKIILGTLEITGIVILGLALYFVAWAIWQISKSVHDRIRRCR